MNELGPEDFEQRSLRAEYLENRRQIHDLLLSQADSYRKLRNLGILYPLGIAAAWAPEIAKLSDIKYAIAAGAVAMSAALGAPGELQRKRSKRDARAEAEVALGVAEIEPPLPVPRWVRRELQLEE